MDQVKVLVCGSRTFRDQEVLERVLDELKSEMAEHGWEPVIVEGGALGADRLARVWARKRRLDVVTVRAEWEREGRSAGFKRNQRMLDMGPDFVVAFVDKPLADSKGTADMVGRARAAGVRGKVVSCCG